PYRRGTWPPAHRERCGSSSTSRSSASPRTSARCSRWPAWRGASSPPPWRGPRASAATTPRAAGGGPRRGGGGFPGAGGAGWPDGTVAGRYAFIHALYQEVLYARVSVGEQVGLHLRTGARLERAYGARAGEIAGELATHFDHGRDFARAVRYRTEAAGRALGQ